MTSTTVSTTVDTGENSAPVEGVVIDAPATVAKVPTIAQLASRIGSLTASRATAAIQKKGKELDRLVETTEGLLDLNAMIGAKVKENDTFLGAYAYALYCRGKGMTATEFADKRGISKPRVTQYARTWRLFAEFGIEPGTPEWSMTSTWQNSPEATALFNRKGDDKATRDDFVAGYAKSLLPKPAAITSNTDAPDTRNNASTPGTDATATDAPATGDAPATDATPPATGDDRVSRPNGESDKAPDFAGVKAIDRLHYAQTALGVKRSDVKGKDAREVLAAIMAQCAMLLESGE